MRVLATRRRTAPPPAASGGVPRHRPLRHQQRRPFEPLAERVWELRGTVATFDAWYVALAERLDLELATLDAGLMRAAGPGCRFHTAPFADAPGRG